MPTRDTRTKNYYSHDDINFFAETNWRNQRQKFGIRREDRRKHMYIIGKTGMGKSSMLENMIVQDIKAGEGVCVIDPHGDLAEQLIHFIPKERISETIYFNPGDISYPIAFNVLEAGSHEEKQLVASGLVLVFKKLWADSWGPRLEYVLRHAILALLDYPESTLLGVMKILVDETYRRRVIEKIQDPMVKSFWQDEFSNYPDRFMAKAVAPIQNKVGQFLSNSLIRNILGQPQSSFNLRQVMDEKKILILNLSKGRLGDDAAMLLGAMMVTKLHIAAMSRIDSLEDERGDFYVYVDEFQNFATESFADILSEARKYRLNLILAHQYIGQLAPTMRQSILGNVGSLISFRVGAEDGEFLAKEFAPEFKPADLISLGKYNIALRLMINNLSSKPFTATTLEPLPIVGYANRIIEFSRERYAHSKIEVEKQILVFSQNQSIGQAKKASFEKNAKEINKRQQAKPVQSNQTPIKPGLNRADRGKLFNRLRKLYAEPKPNQTAPKPDLTANWNMPSNQIHAMPAKFRQQIDQEAEFEDAKIVEVKEGEEIALVHDILDSKPK